MLGASLPDHVLNIEWTTFTGIKFSDAYLNVGTKRVELVDIVNQILRNTVLLRFR